MSQLAQVNFLQDFLHGFGTHLGDKTVSVLLAGLAIFHLSEKLFWLERRFAFVHDHVIFVIQDAFEVTRGHIDHQTHPRRHALEKPDMADRHRQLDVAHAFPAHARQCHFDAATIANHAAMFDALVLAAIAFPVANRSKNALAEQTALLGLECPVIDRLRVLDFSV